MKIELSKEELEELLKNRKGHIFLNDPIFDRLYKEIGANPPKNRKDVYWQYERANPPKKRNDVEPSRFNGEANCIDFSDSYNKKAGMHDYKCMKCWHSLDYFVGGTENWWCRTMPNFCPNCGSKLTEGSFKNE